MPYKRRGYMKGRTKRKSKSQFRAQTGSSAYRAVSSRKNFNVKYGQSMGCPRVSPHVTTIARTLRYLDPVAGTFNGLLGQPVTSSGVTPAGYQIANKVQFLPQTMSGWSEFKTLYNLYRVTKVRMTFIPSYPTNVQVFTPSSVPAVQEDGQLMAGPRMIMLGWAPDYQYEPLDAASASKEDYWLELEAYQQHPFDKTITIEFTPVVTTTVISTLPVTTTTAYASAYNKAMPWTSTADNVALGGLQFRLYDPIAANAIAFSSCAIYLTCTIEFKGVH